MSDLNTLLKDLGFFTTYEVSELVPLAKVFLHKRKCGIYVLHFINEEIYVGKAVNVLRRYFQHCKTYSDILKVSFKPVAPSKLDSEEIAVIFALEKAGYHLRNILHASITYAPSAFDEIMSPDDQEKWVGNLMYQNLDGERKDNPELRRKYTRNYEQLLLKPSAKEIIEVAQEYVRIGIPSPVRSEMFYWSCSCLPAGDKRIYIRININWQEVFAAYVDQDKPFFVFNVAKSPLELKLGKYRVFRFDKFLQHRSLYRFKQRYAPGGQDQLVLEVHGTIQDAMSVLHDTNVLFAIRNFNLRLMRKGTNASYRFHCFDLADRLLQFS